VIVFQQDEVKYYTALLGVGDLVEGGLVGRSFSSTMSGSW
jgi:hypothetical protein